MSDWVESLKRAKLYMHEDRDGTIEFSTSPHRDKARRGYRLFFIRFHGGSDSDARKFNRDIAQAFLDRINAGAEDDGKSP